MHTHNAVANAESSAASSARQVTRYRSISHALRMSVEGPSRRTTAKVGAAKCRGHRKAKTANDQPESAIAEIPNISRTALLLGKGSLEESCGFRELVALILDFMADGANRVPSSGSEKNGAAGH